MLPNNNYKKDLSFEKRLAFYKTQQKYNQWKKAVFPSQSDAPPEIHQDLHEPIAAFIDFGIRRILDVETRKQFIDVLTDLNEKQFANLLKLLFDTPNMGLKDIIEKFATPKKVVIANKVQSTESHTVTADIITNNVESTGETIKKNEPTEISLLKRVVLSGTEIDGMPIEAHELGLLPEIFESQQKNIPNQISAPTSLAMKTFTDFQKWACQQENKNMLEKLKSQLDTDNTGNIDFVFHRKDQEKQKFYDIQQKYDQWKTAVFPSQSDAPPEIHQDLHEPIAAFIDFGIRRILDVETRNQFIDFLTDLNEKQFANLLKLLFDTPNMGLKDIIEKFATPTEADESQQKNIPNQISAPISLAMETFTHFQEWACQQENKKALENLKSQLNESNIDFVFKRTETHISSVPP